MDPLVDRFLDSLWLEDGLARNTLAAYRRDLDGLGRWLASRETSLLGAGEAALAAALEPTPGDWVYFVALKPGSDVTRFTASYDEFLQFKDEFYAEVG